MKVNILQDKLSKGLSSVIRVVSSRPTLPILSNVLIEAKSGRVLLSTTDLNLGIRLWLGAKVEEEGAVTVPAKVISDLVSSFSPSTITLSSDESSLRVSGSGHQARLAGIPASEFPSLGKVSSKKGLKIETKTFKHVIERVVLSASTDETRPVLSGVLWKFSEKQLQLVATDGYRLSLVNVPYTGKSSPSTWQKMVKEVVGGGVIIPARALRDVEKLAEEVQVKEVELSLAKQQNLAVFSLGDAELTTRLIEGTFPNFTQVIPKEKVGESTIEVELLEKAVKTASIFARDSANIIHWKIGNDALVVSANAPSYGESESTVEISLKGEGGNIAFNSRYLIDFFSIFPSKKVLFRMKGSLDPGVFQPAGKEREDFLYLIMPVRVQK